MKASDEDQSYSKTRKQIFYSDFESNTEKYDFCEQIQIITWAIIITSSLPTVSSPCIFATHLTLGLFQVKISSLKMIVQHRTQRHPYWPFYLNAGLFLISFVIWITQSSLPWDDFPSQDSTLWPCLTILDQQCWPKMVSDHVVEPDYGVYMA